MGGGGGPTPVPANASPEFKAYAATKPALFNGAKGREYWEGSFYLFAGSLMFATFAFPYLPNTDITDWARDEAETRKAMRERGEEVHFGMNYAALTRGVASFSAEAAEGIPVPVTDLEALNAASKE